MLKKLTLCSLTIISHAYAELLIMKKNTEGFLVPLTSAESIKYNDQIAEIMMKYQWPMVIGSKLTPDELFELTSPDTPYAEEQFIQRKLQQAIPHLNLQVIFISTTLYELFALCEFFKNQKTAVFSNQENIYSILEQTNPLNATATLIDFLKDQFKSSIGKPFYINYIKDKPFSLDENQTFSVPGVSKKIVKNDILKQYQKNNALFYQLNTRLDIEQQVRDQIGSHIDKFHPDRLTLTQQPQESAFLWVNQQLVAFLLNQNSAFQFQKSATDLSDMIEQISLDLAHQLTQNLSVFDMYETMKQSYFNSLSTTQTLYAQMQQAAGAHKKDKQIIQQAIRLDYQARQTNKALLFRGTSFTQTDIDLYRNNELIAGNTLKTSIKSNPAWIDYKQKTLQPYSISFGSSLFAGFVYDPQACAFVFLAGKDDPKKIIDEDDPFGYALLLDKHRFLLNLAPENMFFIPTLSTLASLFQTGEAFHARTKVAIHFKNPNQGYKVIGIHSNSVKDPSGQILIDTDPMKFAAQFSQFIKDNGVFISKGDLKFLATEEQKAIQDIMNAQQDLAKFYKAIYTIKPRIDRITQEHRKKQNKSISQITEEPEFLKFLTL